MHQAFEGTQERMYAAVDGARFERRSDLIVLTCPGVPIPQFNGAWVVDDSEAAVDALAEAVAEVEATGARPWVQTRSGHERTRRRALELGLRQSLSSPGMLMEPGDLVEPSAEIVIGLVGDSDADAASEILAISFGATKEIYESVCRLLQSANEVSWYAGRVCGAIVSTAIGVTAEGATGVFGVATAPEHRGRGYGAALTARAVRDGFSAGSALAYLQASEIGHGVYRRLGFRDVEEYVLMTRPM
jgi:ribosomal protein S18 acetylase RimI-like enzyme